MKNWLYKNPYSFMAMLAVIIVSVLAVNYHLMAWSEPTLPPPQGGLGGGGGGGDSFWADAGSNNIRNINTGNVGIGTDSPGYELQVDGDIGADSFIYTSDESLKTNAKTIESALQKIIRLKGIEFTWRENGQVGIGLLAQEVEKVFPELVIINNENGLKGVQYGNLVAPLIEAIKEQQTEIEKQQQQIKKLTEELDAIKQIIFR